LSYLALTNNDVTRYRLKSQPKHAKKLVHFRLLQSQFSDSLQAKVKATGGELHHSQLRGYQF